MSLRSLSIKLLQIERAMLNLCNKSHRAYPNFKRRTSFLVGSALGAIILYVLRVLLKNYFESLQTVARVFLKIPIFLLFIGVVILAFIFLFNVFALTCEIRDKRSAAKYNSTLDAQRENVKKEYEDLRRQVLDLKKADPSLSNEHFFFDDPHPLESEQFAGVVKTSGSLHQIGEIAFGEVRPRSLRLDGFYAAKSALLCELKPLLGIQEYPYIKLFWDEDFISSNPTMQCSISTLTRANLKPVPLDNIDFDAKIKPEDVIDMYRNHVADPMSLFVRSGIDGSPNLSKAPDTRDAKMLMYIEEYYKKIKEIVSLDRERLKYTSEWSYGAMHAYIQQVGYIVTAGEDNRVVAVIIPAFPVPTLDMHYSLDLFYDEQGASTQFVGNLVVVTFDQNGSHPNMAMIINTFANRNDLPEFDPLQKCPENLSSEVWHYMLRELAAKQVNKE